MPISVCDAGEELFQRQGRSS
jgi:hypothetical protein